MSTTETERHTHAAATPHEAPIAGASPDGSVTDQSFADIERIDLSSPDYLEHAHQRYEAMRAKCPVSQAIFTASEGVEDQRFFNRPIWMVTDYEEGSRALLDRAITVAATSVLSEEQLAQMPEMPEEFKPLARNILTIDPPEHTRLRKLVQPSFTASTIEKLRPRIQQITDELLNAVEAKAAARGERAPDRTMELIAQFSYPLPVTVNCEMLGIPPEDQEQTRLWSENLLSEQTPERQDETRRNIGKFIAYLRNLFAQKRETPGDDLTSQLLQVEVEGDRLTDDEILAMVFVLFVAGHITTVNLIANGVFALLSHPEQADALRRDSSLVPNAVEEILRYYGPAETTTPRLAHEDVELGGQTIARGETLLVVLAAADRDPTRFADPQAFDITREGANRHIAFGKGVHACLGAPLARLEGQIAVETLFRRYPELRLAVPHDEITWAPSFLRSLTGLPLCF
ncbi:MAG: cytochrome P450 [Chloroflexia bacterium]|nr:cytochrome P450 [Chloroflexia bacterium]